jgi:EAL domain-containing protein (putative c-di-GMP-specific phosphodiesterase class I)
MQAMEQTSLGVSGYVESLRRDRDRFVALAFCAADLLLEVNAQGRITFAAGATLSLVGRTPEEIAGSLLLDMIAPEDRVLMSEFLRGMTPGSRLDPVPIRLAGRNGPTPALSLTGYHLPDLPGCFFFTMRLGAAHIFADSTVEVTCDSESGLLERESFAAMAGRQLQEARKRGESLKLTMLRTGNLPKLRESMDREAAQSMMHTLGACLRASSASGHTAARLNEDSYGLIHRASLDIDAMRTRMEDVIRAADPKGVGIKITSGTMDADAGSMNDADTVRVLLYTVNRFCETGMEDLDLSNLSESLEKMTRETTAQMNHFREMAHGGKFDIAFQPIVSLTTHEVHHFEALARFQGDIDRSPYELITFAENTGVITDFDLAMCKRVLEWLTRTAGRGVQHVIAINLSGRSIANTAFVSALHELLKAYQLIRAQVMFEITESAKIVDLEMANRFIQGLRRAGHKVCLDDFGAGSAALKYLHALEIDVVKIDGQYIQSALAKRRYQAFLKAVVGLCHDLGVATIAEMVEDKKCVTMLQKCGVKLGQGYMFGRPSFDINTFHTGTNASAVRPASATAWRSAQGYFGS